MAAGDKTRQKLPLSYNIVPIKRLQINIHWGAQLIAKLANAFDIWITPEVTKKNCVLAPWEILSWKDQFIDMSYEL